MNYTVHIEPYREEGRVVVYTIRYDNEEKNETDRFLERFIDDPEYRKDIQIIVRAIQNIEQRGVETRFLRPEDNCNALPSGASNLRLYCIKGHKFCLILGGGGIKSSQAVKDSPDAYPHFRTMKQIEQVFRENMEEGTIYWDGDYLAGHLALEIEL